MFSITLSGFTLQNREILRKMLVIDRLIAAQDNDVREMPIPCSSFTECWVGFDLGSPGAVEVRHKRDMNEQAVAAADLSRNLTDGLEKRLALDIAGRAADLGDDDVCIRLVADAVNESS